MTRNAPTVGSSAGKAREHSILVYQKQAKSYASEPKTGWDILIALQSAGPVQSGVRQYPAYHQLPKASKW